MAIRRKHHTKMSAGHYLLIADIIRKIEDPATRMVVADHFGTEFNRRSMSFDPMTWNRTTGGKVAPNSARGS